MENYQLSAERVREAIGLRFKGGHMRKILSILVLLLVVGLVVGCGNSSVATQPTPTPIPVPTPYTSTGEEPPADRTWISPGKVIIGNFYSGARAEWPITIHNGNDYEATFQISFRYPDRVEESYYKVVADSWVAPDYGKLPDYGCWVDYGEQKWVYPETLKEDYPDNYSDIVALVSASNTFPKRIVEVDITGKQTTTTYEGTFGEPELHYVNSRIQDWVIIVDPTPVLAPYYMPDSTKDILVILDMPYGVQAPKKWEFWISVKDTTQTGLVATEMASRWLVQMR